jgi:hypothetical protein
LPEPDGRASVLPVSAEAPTGGPGTSSPSCRFAGLGQRDPRYDQAHGQPASAAQRRSTGYGSRKDPGLGLLRSVILGTQGRSALPRMRTGRRASGRGPLLRTVSGGQEPSVEQVVAAYRVALDRQPLAASTRRAYGAKVEQFTHLAGGRRGGPRRSAVGLEVTGGVVAGVGVRSGAGAPPGRSSGRSPPSTASTAS